MVKSTYKITVALIAKQIIEVVKLNHANAHPNIPAIVI